MSRPDAAALPEWRVRTRNTASASENRMHSDEVARRYGYRGGLVPGVVVFGHMTRPVVEHFGARWLARGWAEVRFRQPAYEGEMLTVAADPTGPDETLTLSCRNEEGVELARMSAGWNRGPAAGDPRARMAPSAPPAGRPEATWDRMVIGEPFPALAWRPSGEENREWCEQTRDDLACYRDGDPRFVHPGLLLRQGNAVLKNRFVLPAWIHVASRITFHRAVGIGADCEVRAIPEEKWRRNGHEFVRLYVAVMACGAVATEVLHTAIFRPRPAESASESR